MRLREETVRTEDSVRIGLGGLINCEEVSHGEVETPIILFRDAT